MTAKPIETYIQKGRENAITREQLCALTGLPDRRVREEIEQARRRGEIIVNIQDGAGYYKPQKIADIIRQYNLNNRRAKSILAQQKHLLKCIQDAGVQMGPQNK